MKWRMKQRAIAMIMTVLMVVGLMPVDLLGGVSRVKADGEFLDGLTATTAEAGKNYVFDFTGMSDISNTYSKGLFSFSAGGYHAASYNNTTYGVEFKSDNKLTFAVAGNCTIIVGGDNNNTCTDLAATSDTGVLTPTTQSTKTDAHASLDDVKSAGSNTLSYTYTGTAGQVTLELDPEYAGGDGSTKAYIAYIAIVPAEATVKIVNADVNYDGTKIATLSGTYTSAGLNAALAPTSYEFSAEPDASKLTVTAGSTDQYLQAGDTYVVSMNTANKKIAVSYKPATGATQAIAEMTYTYIEPLGTLLTLDKGQKVTYTFNGAQASSNGYPAGCSKVQKFLMSDKYLMVEKASAGATFAWHDAQHGLVISKTTTFIANVPAHAAGTFTVPLCCYSGTATIGIEGNGDEITFTGDSTAEPVDKPSFTYINNTDETVEVKLVYDTAATCYVHSLEYAVSDLATITGTVTAVGKATIPSGTQVVYTAGGTSYKAAITIATDSKSGTYSMALPVSTTEVTYDITYSDGSYIVSPGEETIGVVAGMSDAAKVKDLHLTKLATYTLSGNVIGLDAANLNNLALAFSLAPGEESDYAIPDVTLDKTTGAYSIVLEQGVKYAVTAEGVDDYTLDTQNVQFTANTTQDLAFTAKPTYKVTLKSNSALDLSTLSDVTYIFTLTDASAKQYTFTDVNNITLRDGTYKLTIDGQNYHKLGLKIADGINFTVNGSELTHIVRFEEAASWSFVSGNTVDSYYYKDAQVIEKGKTETGYYNGLYIDTTAGGKLSARGSDSQFNVGTKIYVPVRATTCSISVNVYPGYAYYNIQGDPVTENSGTRDYNGTPDLTLNGVDYALVEATDNSYIYGIAVTYPATFAADVEQSVMPYVPADDTDANTAADTDGSPRANVASNITISAQGQSLNLKQAGGAFAEAAADTSGLSYFVFPLTKDANNLEFDVQITENSSTANQSGFFAGLFTNNNAYTLGLRKGGTQIRGLYSKNGGYAIGAYAGATDPAEENIDLKTPVHYLIGLDGEKPKVTITFKTDDGIQTRTFSASPNDESVGYHFGMMLANVSATVTNMVYTNAEGTVLYSQNNAYKPKGAAPVPTGALAANADGTISQYIHLSWDGDIPEYDGTYVVEVSTDGGNTWSVVTEDVTTFSYDYEVETATTNTYVFRVSGQLGKPNLGGTRTDAKIVSDSIGPITGALSKPVVTISSDASGISLEWQAVKDAETFDVFRYSFDQGEAYAVEPYATVAGTSFRDSAAEKEMPYYYFVKAKNSAGNFSEASETVWDMVIDPAAHTGAYVYEDDATEIFITKKSYDTVYKNQAVLEGIVYGDGNLQALVNGATQQSSTLSARDSFSYTLTLEEGRNDVELLFTDGNNKVTRKAFNFVFLTNYDIIADASYTGEDGAANEDGIPVYKTVTAAIEKAASNDSGHRVILIKEGSYEERLVVNTPDITLIGEDRDNTVIHFYPGVLGQKYEAGEDMDKRCATYIQSGATDFSAENLTFKNDYDYATNDSKSNKSADAIRVEADKAVFVNVRFTGVQDTLYMHSGHQYYNKCLIEGLVDYIYSGDEARALFNDCELRYVYQATKAGGYVSAPRSAEDATYGLIFKDCVITAEEGCNGNGYLLARPWGPNAYIAWINCFMGKSVNKYTPYHDMSGNSYLAARFYEYGTYGPAFAVNSDRKQLSTKKATAMTTDAYLGWAPRATANAISADHYIGTQTTTSQDKTQTAEPNDDKYLWTDGDDTGLAMYDVEGYAAAYKVTGGGLLKEENDNYYKVSNANEFLDALAASKKTGKDSVIELTQDINLGCNEVENFESYSSIIKAYTAQAQTHPALIASGTSVLNFENVYNLTIFSLNGSSIKHANITMKNSENIIIRNIKFDELWEWDETTKGNYDRNDWDYMTIDSGTNGIWIDHCTFYKAYDGVVDIKNPDPEQNVTISWCEFLPGSEDNVFFNQMMDALAADPAAYPYYQSLLNSNMTQEQIWWYAYGQKKTHLMGQSDSATNAVGIRATLANNYYKDSMDRMPRLRYGNAHVYNCIMDAQELLDVRNAITNANAAKHIVSNGASSTCGAQILLENCYINGIEKALNSGNGESAPGYINAVNSVYYVNGTPTTLEPKNNSTNEDQSVLVTDADAFVASLPYSGYHLYEAEYLDQILTPGAGAGKMSFTVLQWEKASYNAEFEAPTIVKAVKYDIAEGIPAEVLTDEVKAATGCTTPEMLVAYMIDKIGNDPAAQSILPEMTPEDTLVVDVTVLVSLDGGVTWEKATKENFPTTGLDIVIPYPDETNGWDYDFVVGHLIVLGANGTKVGSMEYFDPAKTDDGLRVHIMSASPFVVGWVKHADTEESGSSVSTDDGYYVPTTSNGNKYSELPVTNHTGTRMVVTTSMNMAKLAAGAAGDEYLEVEIDPLQGDNAAVKLIETLAAKNKLTVSGYMDVNVYRVSSTGVRLGRVTDLKSPMDLLFAIPEGLDGNQYDFGVIRVHDGVAELLKDADNDPITITVFSDKFSAYAIVYGPKGSIADSKAGGTKTVSKSGKNASPKTFDQSKFVPKVPETELAQFAQKQVEKQLEQEAADLLITPQASRFPFGIVIAALLALAAFVGGEVYFFRRKKKN